MSRQQSVARFGADLIADLPANLLAVHYLALSYQYYHLNQTVVPDHEFDLICTNLLDKYDQITAMDLKLAVAREDLEAGTCLKGAWDFPSRIQQTSDSYRDNMLSGAVTTELRKTFLGRPQPKPTPTMVRRRRAVPAPAVEAAAPAVRRRRPVTATQTTPTVIRRRTRT